MLDQSIEESGQAGVEEGKEKEITDNLVDMCQVKCFLCDTKMYLNSFKRHLQKEHDDFDADEPCKIEFIKRTFYKCKMCDVTVLFHFDAINKHLSTVHSTTMHSYKTQYTAFTGDKEYKAVIKAADKEKARQNRIARHAEALTDAMGLTASNPPNSKPKSKNNTAATRGKARSKFQMDEAAILKWSITLNNTMRYYSNNLEEMCVRRCRVCDEIMLADALKAHIYQNHRGIKENTSSMDYVRSVHVFILI